LSGQTLGLRQQPRRSTGAFSIDAEPNHASSV
jgi:hypothetical protein